MTCQVSLGHALSSSLCMTLQLSETLLPLRSTLFPSCPLNRADLLTCFYQWILKKWHYGASKIGLKSLECWETEYTHDPSPITGNKRTLTTAGPETNHHLCSHWPRKTGTQEMTVTLAILVLQLSPHYQAEKANSVLHTNYTGCLSPSQHNSMSRFPEPTTYS